MYNVIEMKNKIETAVSIAENEVKEEFMQLFKNIYKNNSVPNNLSDPKIISLIHLTSYSDLERVISGAGFYVILSDYDAQNNGCILTLNENIRAIYRGEGNTVKKRIQSHLFNSRYKEDYDKRKQKYLNKPENAGRSYYEVFWPACIKLGDGSNGINIDVDEKYNEYSWFLIIHNMRGSSQEVRVQAELAFDELFGKPLACRENT
ncbi:MAG: hypothetical protein SCALA702_00390 [Melioribacteraceae bacterium]|nr:MAG: hypothetical protein SCALA702_00390 [Melioribacteraceae bacterium]